MEFPEIPGYKVEKQLGKGGMAVVYLALQENFERKVALKIMAKHLLSDPSFGDRFLREARIVAQLSHQNIVPVYDVGQYQDYHYMAMEYLPEGDLKGKLKKGLPLSEGVEIIKAIASGLDYAHKKNFIHRDIKPENILFREDGSPVISDFGIARNTESETKMTMTGTVIGSPHYMSPEQAEAAQLDGRTDLYSLGVILYEMLTGAVPFSGESAISIGIKHITAELPPLPPEMEQFQGFIDIALAKDRNERFQTGAEFREALEEVAFDLSDTGAATVLMSNDDLKMGSSASRSSRASGSRSASRSSRASRASGARRSGLSASRRTPPPKPGLSKTAIALAVVGVSALGAVGGWYYLETQKTPGNAPFGQQSTAAARPAAPLTPKQRELLDNADKAIQEQRYYNPVGDNAQYYLTTLLALSPNLPQAQEAIENLFRIYLAQAQTAIATKNLDTANNFLNQSSQITFYIQNQSLLNQQRELRTNVIAAQQQQIIAGTRNEEIKSILEKADAALAAGRLTEPEGDNAYAYYQSIFELDANNDKAQAGLKAVADAFLKQATGHVSAKEYAKARAKVAAATQVLPTHPGLTSAQQAISDAEAADLAAMKAAEQAAYEEELARQEKARKERQAKIAQLQSEIDEAIQANRLTVPEGSSALDKIRELQNLDPGNANALKSLERLVNKLAALASSAIERGDLDTAERHLRLAQQLSPTNNNVAEAQKALRVEKDRRAELAAIERARQQSIKQALDEADTHIAADKPVAALESLGKALEIDPQHKRANQLRTTLLKSAYVTAKQQIESGEFVAAEALLDGLTRNNADPKEIARLRSLLADEREAAAFAASEEGQLLFKTADLETKNRTPAINEELRGLYQRLIEINPDEKSYRTGLRKTSDYEITLAANALRERDFQAVRERLNIVRAATPGHPGIARIDNELAATMRAQEQASELLANARSYIETPYEKPGLFGNNDEARQTYRNGFKSISSARQVDDAHPELEAVFRELEAKYADIINIHLTDKDYDEAKQFIDDYRSYDWGGSPSEPMQAALDRYNASTAGNTSEPEVQPVAAKEESPQEEKKKPRFIGGGF